MGKKLHHCNKKIDVKATYRLYGVKDFPVVFLHQAECDVNGGHKVYAWQGMTLEHGLSDLFKIETRDQWQWDVMISSGQAQLVQPNGREMKETRGRLVASQFTNSINKPADEAMNYLRRLDKQRRAPLHERALAKLKTVFS